MPIGLTYPGVYVQEAASGSHNITGVSTSVTAFVGFFRKGPMNSPVQVFNFGDFERIFGGLDSRSEASYGVLQFFANGGEIAWIVRIAGSTATATLAASGITVQSAAGGQAQATLQIQAASPGAWGNSVYVDVDYNAAVAGQFNIEATEYGVLAGNISALSTVSSRNLSMDPASPGYAPAVVANTAGTLLSLKVLDGATVLPAQTGLTGAPLSASFDINKIGGHTMVPQLNSKPLNATVTFPAVTNASKYMVPGLLQSELRKIPELASATVEMFNDSVRVRLLDSASAKSIVAFQGQLASDLGLSGRGAQANVQRYVLGGPAAGAQTNPVTGGDGVLPGATEIIGSSFQRTGIYSLEAVDVFNLLSIPSTRSLPENQALAVNAEATRYCEERLAFFLADMNELVNSTSAARAWLDGNNSFASPNNAVYFPFLNIPDPLNEHRLRAVASSGTMAGLYARMDSSRGVWHAPAGTDAVLKGVRSLSYTLTDDENGVLNPLGINAFRTFPVIGNTSWGARTMDGSDVKGSQWKYIPVRRVALYIEASLKRGLQWAVFQPNGEILWRQIALSVTAFMQNLFQQGAFKGTTPKQAYFVACDATTTSQADIDNGIVNIIVGFAPLKPAEFVVITIQQVAAEASN